MKPNLMFYHIFLTLHDTRKEGNSFQTQVTYGRNQLTRIWLNINTLGDTELLNHRNSSIPNNQHSSWLPDSWFLNNTASKKSQKYCH